MLPPRGVVTNPAIAEPGGWGYRAARTMKDGAEFGRLWTAAAERAKAAGRSPGSLDVLAGILKLDGAAARLLREHGVDGRAVEGAPPAATDESTLLVELKERARETARGLGAGEVDGLHVLLALTRARCAAQGLLTARGMDLAAFRNKALSYLVSGRMPRRLRAGHEEKGAPGGEDGEGESPARPPRTGESLSARLGRRVSGVGTGGSPRGDETPPAPGGRRVPGVLPGDSSRAGALASAPGMQTSSGATLSASGARLSPPATPDGSSRADPPSTAPSGPPVPGTMPSASPRVGEPASASGDQAASGATQGARSRADAEPPAPGARAAPPPAPPPYSPPPKRKLPPPGAPIDAAHFPTLFSLGRNLTELARTGKLDPVVGRDREIEQVIDILGKRRTNNPCLVGEAGVGKTAVVEGVAQKLRGFKGQLGRTVVMELDVAGLVAGTQLRGSLSERLLQLKDEVRAADGRVVVFIDELHTLVGAGATGEGAQDASNELKTALARGEFPCIGATTHDEYQRHVQSDPALERRFTAVQVPEPTVQQATAILKGLVARYEAHHGLRYSHAAVEAVAGLAARYIPDRQLPDKALAVLDLAGSRGRREGKNFLQLPDVARVVAQLAGIPEERLLEDDSKRLLSLEEALSARVVGHGPALKTVAAVLRRNYAGFASGRPMGSFLLLGPTGVGKTEAARALAEVLFGSRDALVRVDMSELSEPHATARLVGAPAGYVGHGEGGQLTEAVRRRPSCVVLLDEIEKAHRDAWMLLLQVLEEGQLTDGRGRHVNFSHAVVVLTSNLGAESFLKHAGAEAEEEVLAAARRALPPELWNRLDERLVFGPLSEQDVAQVARLLLAESSARLQAEKGIRFEAPPEAVAFLLRHGGFDPLLGARPMRQAVQRWVEAALAEEILAGRVKPGDVVKLRVEGDRLVPGR